MAKRVFQLAKELGVRSKDVLEKCRAEGLELKNHMAALSAGLEATIREWFSDQATTHSAVERAEAVDVSEARKKAAAQRRRRKKKEAEEEEALTSETALTSEPVLAAEPVLTAEPAEAALTAPAEEDTGAATAAAEPPLPEPAVAEDSPPALVAAEESQGPEAVVPAAEVEPTEEVVEARPEPPMVEAVVPPEPPIEQIKPAGPQVVPTPAKLQGPTVVRVESPDRVPVPSRSGPRRPRGAEPVFGEELAIPVTPTDQAGAVQRGTAGEQERARKAKRRSPRYRGGRSAASSDGSRQWRERDLFERRERLAAATTGGLRHRRATVNMLAEARAAARSGPCEVEEPITIKSLSAAMGIKGVELVKKLMAQGTLVTVNQTISAETADMLAVEFGLELVIKRRKTLQEQLDERMGEEVATAHIPRPPVVTFLGHVDHGKTSLLDKIRSARVVAGESGGITQHIGSYRYEKEGRVVTFLDTPGHEAFTRMRARGANMTDVVVLVVAADDGVMPQTIEAINHAKAAGVPVVVALNKIDLPNANINRVMGQLAEYGLQPREWGGDTEVIQTSAETGDGIDDLVELLSLEAELLELTADPTTAARGVVVEAEMTHGRGAVARLLIQNGTLRVGDALLAGPGCGRIRQVLNDRGATVSEAGPATPVEVSGLDALPTAGDKFYVVKDIAEAKSIAEEIRTEQREDQLASKQQVTLDNLFEQISAGETTELRLIIKADVQGSVEVLVDSLNKQSTDEVQVKILHAAVGGISASDVLLADAADAIIVGFHVTTDSTAREQAEKAGVDMRFYQVIYELIDEVRAAMEGLLTPEISEEMLGHAEVREVFKVSRVGGVAGCLVTDGMIVRNAKVRVTRGGIVVEDNRTLDSLKRFKDDVREVRAGMECGMKIAGYSDVKVGDVLEAYRTVEVARELQQR